MIACKRITQVVALFRQAKESGPRISIAWRGSNIIDSEGRHDHCFVHFDLETDSDGRRYVDSLFQPQTQASTHAVPCRQHAARIAEAEYAFRRLEEVMLRANEAH